MQCRDVAGRPVINVLQTVARCQHGQDGTSVVAGQQQNGCQEEEKSWDDKNGKDTKDSSGCPATARSTATAAATTAFVV